MNNIFSKSNYLTLYNGYKLKTIFLNLQTYYFNNNQSNLLKPIIYQNYLTASPIFVFCRIKIKSNEKITLTNF